MHDLQCDEPVAGSRPRDKRAAQHRRAIETTDNGDGRAIAIDHLDACFSGIEHGKPCELESEDFAANDQARISDAGNLSQCERSIGIEHHALRPQAAQGGCFALQVSEVGFRFSALCDGAGGGVDLVEFDQLRRTKGGFGS